MLTLAELMEVTNGSLSGEDVRIGAVRIDSRSVKTNDLFVAIRGERLDGHDFIGDAVRRGAGGVLVSRPVREDVPQVIVSDTTAALGQLATHWRRRFDLPVIGITGSNGKTTVTAMVREILSVSGHPLAPRESFNNQWGVPLTLLELTRSHSHAVIEMGMNRPGEIDSLTRMVIPDVAVINNAVAAHLEGLGTVERVARAKGEILGGLNTAGTAILNRDDPNFFYWRDLVGKRGFLTFGSDRNADFRADDCELDTDSSRFRVGGQGAATFISLAVPGRHNIMNALAAMAACHAVGVTSEDMTRGLSGFTGIPGRLRRLQSAGGATLIDDSFNANPSSMEAAIDYLSWQQGRRILVLGAMAELGTTARELHDEVGRHAFREGIDRLLVLNDADNPVLEGYRTGFGKRTETYTDVTPLVDSLRTEDLSGNTILVKGSKSSRMARVVEALTDRNTSGGLTC